MRYFIFLSLTTFIISCSSGSNDNAIVVDDGTDTVMELDSFSIVKSKLDKSPNNISILFESAKFYIRHGEVTEAKTHLEKILFLDSSELGAHKVYADIMIAQLNVDQGKYHYEYILERDSLNTGALVGLGKLYAILNNSGKATFYLNEALRINPYLAEPYFMKGMIYRSDYYTSGRQESWDRALSSFQTTVEQDPNYYSAYVQMGVMYDEKGDDVALEYYNSALDIFPESLEALYNKGMYYQNRKQPELALECYREANRVDSTWADAYFNEGYVHMFQLEDLDSALFFFEKATYWDPNYFQAYNNIGLAYEKKGDFNNARKNYQKAIEINPDYQLAKDNLNALQ